MANAPLPVARSHCSWQHLFFLRIQSSRDNPQQTQLACSTNSVSLSPHLCESVIRFCRHESVWISGYNPGNHFRSRQSRMIHLKTNTPNTCSHAKCSCRTLPMKRKRCRCKGRLRQSVHHSLVAALAKSAGGLQGLWEVYRWFIAYAGRKSDSGGPEQLWKTRIGQLRHNANVPSCVSCPLAGQSKKQDHRNTHDIMTFKLGDSWRH